MAASGYGRLLFVGPASCCSSDFLSCRRSVLVSDRIPFIPKIRDLAADHVLLINVACPYILFIKCSVAFLLTLAATCFVFGKLLGNVLAD